MAIRLNFVYVERFSDFFALRCAHRSLELGRGQLELEQEWKFSYEKARRWAGLFLQLTREALIHQLARV